MKALRLTLIASILAFATAQAAGDDLPVETIVVTAKRPAFLVAEDSMLIVTVTASASSSAPTRVIAHVVTESAADSLVLEAPATKPVIEMPTLEPPKLLIAPPRIVLALEDTLLSQG